MSDADPLTPDPPPELPYADPAPVRLGVAEELLRLADDPRWKRKPKVRAELRRMAFAWARTLPDGPEKDHILSLDDR